MLSLGSAAFDVEGRMVDTFSANLQTLPGAQSDARTMQWWAGQPQAWAAHREDTRPAEEVMGRYVQWLDSLSSREHAKPVFVAWPAGFDFTFVYWYLIQFAGRSPFGHSALDMRSYAMALLGRDYGAVGKGSLPTEWIPEARHTHVAIDDAIEQGQLFANMLRAGRGKR